MKTFYFIFNLTLLYYILDKKKIPQEQSHVLLSCKMEGKGPINNYHIEKVLNHSRSHGGY